MHTQRRSIELLSPELRNQIAAGEVVERPASVLKELVENALDAGATHITVHLEGGGQSLIKVQDNGYGMAAHELELAVTRHATSKIHQLDDLMSIASYGFRGEALPSIASVSRLSMTSTVQGQEVAQHIRVEYGTTTHHGAAALPRGTLIEVRDLFSNIPARLKFLKTPSTEHKKAQDWLVRLALAQPLVGFTLMIASRKALHVPAGQTKEQRLSEFWPPHIMDAMRPFDTTHHDIRAHGLASLPHVSQTRNDRMLFYVNGRTVHDKTLAAAVRDAYKGRLTSKDFPQVLLFLEIDTQEVDVNVHPAKTEVRFRNTSNVFSCVRRAVGTVLALIPHAHNHEHAQGEVRTFAGEKKSPEEHFQARLAPSAPRDFWGRLDAPGIARKGSPSASYTHAAQREEAHAPARQEGIVESGKSAFAGIDASYTPSSTPYDVSYIASASDSPPDNSVFNSSVCDVSSDTTDFAGGLAEDGIFTELDHDSALVHKTHAADEKSCAPSLGNAHQTFTYLGHIGHTYLVFRENETSLVLLDQHAVHERILFTQIRENALRGTGQWQVVPLELSLHSSEVERFIDVQDTLVRMGFDMEYDRKKLVVKAVPAMLTRVEAQHFLREALAGTKDDLTKLHISMSCKAAIKAGTPLAQPEAMALLQQWLNVPERDFCPHGRPCLLRWAQSDMEKMFKRS